MAYKGNVHPIHGSPVRGPGGGGGGTPAGSPPR